MKKFAVKSVAAFSLLLGTAVSVQATKPSPPPGWNPSAPHTDLKAFPAPAPGMKQFVINLPTQANPESFRVGIIAGRMEETDGINQVGIAGRLTEKILQGWGYNYFEIEGADGPSMTTLIGVPPGTPRVTKFITLPEHLMTYNSRLPIVVYAPDNFEVRYRIYKAGPEQSASVVASSEPHISEPVSAGPGEVILGLPLEAHLPNGAIATISLYDSMLMDVDSTYARHTLPISKLPARLPLPTVTHMPFIAGPAVSVTIRDANGKLLYWNDTVTPINEAGPTRMKMIRTH